MVLSTEKLAYVYRHIRNDKNVPFYIGIGTDKTFKRARAKALRNPIWKRIANKTTYDVEILFQDVPLSFAKQKEIEFIKLYGRIDNNDGTLANLSGGGDGMFDVSQSVRKRLSELNKGERNGFYNKKHTEETKSLFRQQRRGVKRSPLREDTKRKIGDKNKGKGGKLREGLKDPKGALTRTGVGHSTYKGIVYCFNHKGDIVHKFIAVRYAADFFKARTQEISRVINGGRTQYKQHYFSYSETGFKPFIPLKQGIKKVIDNSTGVIYNSILEAAKASGIPHRNLARYLTGKRANKTSFSYFQKS